MLPFEILALIPLVSVSAAVAPPLQRRLVGNFTHTDAFVHQESTATGFEEPLGTPTNSFAAPVLGVSVPGWETTIPTVLIGRLTTEVPPPFIVIETPTVIFAHTEIEASATKFNPASESTLEPTDWNPPHKTQVDVPGPASSSDLLHEIISRLHDAAPGATPQPANPTDGSLYTVSGDEFSALPQVTPGPSAQATLVAGGSITLQGATLVLTPGLSTTIGMGGDPTYISLTTEDGGQTIVVVSSSGTEISATVTNAPVTLTLPKTGFDASQTAEARPGTLANYSSSGAAGSLTARKSAAAMVWINGTSWWICLTGLIFGIILML